MALNEFQLIERYFAAGGLRREDVVLGIGDDAALLRVPPGMELAVSIDTLVEGVHFPAGTQAAAVGHKALAVGLSDLAAMGAEPAWATLSLSLPEADEDWLGGFASGLSALAGRYGVQLVGGDTVRGPLVVTLQVHGLVPAGQALRRRGARPGDRVYVTGTLGDAGLGLRLLRGELQATAADTAYARGRLDLPQPRVETGLALRGIASAAIDVSDGLAADLGHILEVGGVGAVIDASALPLSEALVRSVEPAAALELALTAGDDYELCFTVPAAKVEDLAGLSCTCIGQIEAGCGLRVAAADGSPVPLDHLGFDHFGGGEGA